MNTKFDLETMLSSPAVKQIPCDMLKPYRNHRFELYKGERLEDMVVSIKKNGVLSPIIVQPLDDGYEILIGHNRWNASKLAGLTAVPAIVKTGLTEEEMEIYVTESNLIQRGFDNLRISEQAAVIAQRHSEMFSRGKRNDIIRELAILEGREIPTSDPPGLKSETAADVNDNLGDEYGLGRTTVVRLVRIDKLINELKDLLDSRAIAIRTGVELSFLSENAQAVVAECADDGRIDYKKAKKLRDSADSDGNIDRDMICSIIYDSDSDSASKPRTVKISSQSFTKYFTAGTKPKEITETVEKALEFYFRNMEGI